MFEAMKGRSVLILLLTIFGVACTTSSQILPVTPNLSVDESPTRGAGRTMSLTVEDTRDSNIIGFRDPEDPSTKITSAPETLRNIRQKLEAAFTELGFTLVEPGEPADVLLDVRLTELSYQRQVAGVIKNLRTGATVEASSVMGDRTVKGTYRDGQGKDTVLRPSLALTAAYCNHLPQGRSTILKNRAI